MEQWLITLSTTHAYLVYAALVIVTIVEGPMLSILFGILLHLGYFSFVPVYASLMLGDLIGDTAWYHIGHRYGAGVVRRFGKRFPMLNEKNIDKVKTMFHKHKYKILFISKITTGFGLAIVTLVTAGMVEIPFLQFIGINALGQFVWSGMLLAVGYYFGHLYGEIQSVSGKASLVILFAILVFIVIKAKQYYGKKMSEQSK